MNGPDAYLKAMYQAACDGEPVDWNAVAGLVEAHKNDAVRRATSERNSMNHPLRSEIEMAQDMIQRIEEAANELAAAIETEKYAKQAAADARNTLAGAEAEVITDAVVAAIAGDGLLAGIAKTSKAYDSAIEALRQRAYRNGLGAYVTAVSVTQRRAIDAAIALEQAQTRFSALRHAGELQAAILRAATL